MEGLFDKLKRRSRVPEEIFLRFDFDYPITLGRDETLDIKKFLFERRHRTLKKLTLWSMLNSRMLSDFVTTRSRS